jgi:hypothetical protein
VKILKREFIANQDLVQRFLNEARAANAIHHARRTHRQMGRPMQACAVRSRADGASCASLRSNAAGRWGDPCKLAQ